MHLLLVVAVTVVDDVVATVVLNLRRVPCMIWNVYLKLFHFNSFFCFLFGSVTFVTPFLFQIFCWSVINTLVKTFLFTLSNFIVSNSSKAVLTSLWTAHSEQWIHLFFASSSPSPLSPSCWLWNLNPVFGFGYKYLLWQKKYRKRTKK